MLLKILGRQLRKKRKACEGFRVSEGKPSLMPTTGMLKREQKRNEEPKFKKASKT